MNENRRCSVWFHFAAHGRLLERAPFDGGTEIEIRPVFEAEDFGKEFTPELRVQEERLRTEIKSKS